MKCPACGNNKMQTVASCAGNKRQVVSGGQAHETYRRRSCPKCGHRTTTMEILKTDYDQLKGTQHGTDNPN